VAIDRRGLDCRCRPGETLALGDLVLENNAWGANQVSRFRIWLTSSPAAGEASITHEVMFWVGHGGGPRPAGSFARTVTLADGRTTDLWTGPM
jgi:hypothetical protein